MERAWGIAGNIWAVMRKHAQALFFVGIFLFVTICVSSLRHNNQEMVRLRNIVFETDKNGGDVDTAMKNLQRHVYSHMNTGLSSGSNPVYPPIQLKYTYERLQAQRQQSVSQANEAMYNDAQASCNAQGYSTGADSLACVDRYLSDRGVNLGDTPKSLYQFDFVAAKWSPDMAGLSMLAAIFCAIGYMWTLVKELFRRKL